MKINERSVAQFSISSAPSDKQGYLNKKGELNRGYQRRWFVLKGNLLYYFERKFEKEPIGVIVLENCHVELAVSGEPYAFEINFGGDGNRVYVLGADTPQEMESWMKAISHANYDYMKMMVEELDFKLSRLSASSGTQSEELTSSTEASFLSSTDSVKSGLGSTEKEKSLSISNKLLINLEEENPQSQLSRRSDLETRASMGRFEPSVGHLIGAEGDNGLPMGTEFYLNETSDVYSLPKPEDEFMSIPSFSELKRFDVLRNEELMGLDSTELRSHSLYLESRNSTGHLRHQRSKSERRRNNLKSTYDNVDLAMVDKGKFRTVARSVNCDPTGLTESRTTIFKHLHEQYGASIWVKVKEFGKQDIIK